MSGFNWWIVAPAQTMGVDNANANPINVATLPTTTRMVQWREGRGELEATTGPPLRTTFTDPTPYAPFFQQFLTLLTTSGLTLAQAKKVQNDLVDCIYDAKRQLPYSFDVAGGAGVESWSARDEDIAALSLSVIPFLNTSVGSGSGSLVSQINAMIDQLNSLVNSGIVSPGNLHVFDTTTINNAINSSIVPNLLSQLPAHSVTGVTGITSVASPGLSSLAGTGAANPGNMANLAVSHIAGIGAGTANIPWSPINATAPLLLTMTEATGLMTGIATRRQTLINTRYSKRAAINALSTIAAVIAYDVTSGW